MTGRTIGKYRILEKLGRGATGTVYKAVDETLAREVAVKVLNPEMADSDAMKDFEAEARTLAKLNHPEIVRVHEFHRADADLLMVMELVRGETLDELLQRSGVLPPERAAYLMARVLGALTLAHGAGVVHRDLKPSNVMVTDQGAVKILDFGMARVAAAEHMTAVGPLLDAPAYMAPERVLGHDVDSRADVYSVGVLFYRLLTGHLPFEADGPADMVRKQLSEAPTPARTYRPDLPPWCEAVLDRALAKSPEERFPTADAFFTALQGAIGGTATEQTGTFAAPAVASTGTLPVVARGTPSTSDVSETVAPPPTDSGQVPVAVPATASGQMPVPMPVPTPVPAPVPTPVPAPTAVPAPVPVAVSGTGTTLVLEKRQFAVAGTVLAALALGVVVLVVIVLRRTPPVVSQAPAVSTETASQPATAPPVFTAPPLAISEPPIRTAPPDAPVSPPDAPAPASQVAQPAPQVSQAAPPPPAPAAPVAAAAKRPPAAPPGRVLPIVAPVNFEAKAVVVDGDKRRERDASVLLADGRMTVTQKDSKVLYQIPLVDVTGVTYSNSRQPLWDSPDGPAEAMRVEGGAFGFLKGGRHWLGLRTKESLLVLRVEEGVVGRVIRALQDHTGLTVARLAEPKE